MNNAYLMDIGTYLEIVELAKAHGKKPGDSMQDEFNEIMNKKQFKDKFKKLGTIDMDVDLLSGNLREQGLKILNLNEINNKEGKK